MALIPIGSHSLFLTFRVSVDSNIIDFINFIDNTTHIFLCLLSFERSSNSQCSQCRFLLASNSLARFLACLSSNPFLLRSQRHLPARPTPLPIKIIYDYTFTISSTLETRGRVRRQTNITIVVFKLMRGNGAKVCRHAV